MSDLSDGKLIFKAQIDNSNVEKDLKALERKIRSSQESISKMNKAKLPLETRMNSLREQAREATAEAAKLEKELERVREATNGSTNPEAYMSAKARLSELEAEYNKSIQQMESLNKQWDTVNTKVENYDAKIKEAEDDIARNTERAGELQRQLVTPKESKMSESLAKAEKTAGSFGKQLRSIAASALMFNLISRGLRNMVSYMGQAAMADENFSAALATLKGSVLTAFQPIYEVAIPAITTLVSWLNVAVQAIGRFFAALTGKSYSQMVKNAQALNKEAAGITSVGDAAEEAQNQLMGFDEINRLESLNASGGASGGGGSSGVTPDFHELEGMNAIEDELMQILGLVAAIAAGLLTWKIASAFMDDMSKAAGLALAVGGAMLYAFNWADAFANGIDWDNLMGILAGTAVMAAGLGLAFGTVGTAIGLLIGSVGLIIAALHEFSETGEVTDEMLVGLAISLGVVGIAISLLTGSWIPALIGLVLGIGTAFGLTSDTIRGAVETALGWISTLWEYINEFFNWLVGSWNNIWGGISQYQTTGTIGDMSGTINYSLMPETPISSIPALARGAVLPANKPFLAMVGDQKSGTNVEAPLETIKQALVEVMAENGMDVDINFTGSLSQLAKVLTPEITKRQRQTERAKGG